MALKGGDPEATTSGVSIEDFKKLESSVETQMKEMYEMFTQVMSSRASESPPPEDPAFAVKDLASAKSDEEKVGEVSINGSPTKIDDGKGGHHAVPFVYSPDPPIPHPHINNRGDPPRQIGRAHV